ncbi:hypothetical protein TMU01_13020 [Tenuibacillus multivorans]|nr:hypothetical protein TMU01_13020 [Tenuibacillus multivorans]
MQNNTWSRLEFLLELENIYLIKLDVLFLGRPFIRIDRSLLTLFFEYFIILENNSFNFLSVNEKILQK